MEVPKGYTPHTGDEQPCADDLPIAYIDWYGDEGGGYSDTLNWHRVRFWKVEK